jgi:hypothetical protein
LKTTPEASPELARALEALRESHESDPARIARVEQKLGPLLDAVPPAATVHWLTHLSFNSVTGKLLATALLAVVGAGWALFAAPREVAHVEAGANARERDPNAAVERAVAVSDELRIEQQGAPIPEEPATFPSSPARNTKASKTGAARPPDKKSLLRSLKTTDDRQGEDESRVDSPTSEPQIAAPVVSELPDNAQRPAPPPQPPTLQSEASLVLSARRQLRTDASRALVSLDQHASLYPQGLLAPEREVLAIEALRKVGRNTEAEQRLVRFRAQYPDSPHLRPLR